MLGKAGDFGCGASDAACLCKDANFAYGVRDCSYQYCQNDTAAAMVVAYGTAYCACEYSLRSICVCSKTDPKLAVGVVVPIGSVSVSGVVSVYPREKIASRID